MYVTQQKQTYEICELYDVPREKIDSKRNNYGIKRSEVIMNTELMKRLIEQANKEGKKYVYAFLKDKIFDFEKCIMPILNYMRDGETYLLREFWQFVNNEKNLITAALGNEITDSYYKAELCVDLLLQNELIKEVEYKQYKIMAKGKELLNRIEGLARKKEITIPVLAKYLDDFKYFDLEFKEGYPTSEEEAYQILDNLKKIAYEEWKKACNKNHPEMLQIEKEIAFKWILAFLNTIIDDPTTPERIKNMEEIDDLIYTLNKGRDIKLKLPKNIYTKEIYKYIDMPQITDIIKLAVSNCAYIKANYEINEI